MRLFLNRYMYHNRNFELQSEEELRHLFTTAVEVIEELLGKEAFSQRGTLMAAVFDAVMIGIARRLQRGPINDRAMLKSAHARLLASESFKGATEYHTSDSERVKDRLQAATAAFDRIL